MHWGWQSAAPNELPDARQGDAPKGALLGLDGGVNAFFCIVPCWQGVKTAKDGLNCAVFNALGAVVYRSH